MTATTDAPAKAAPKPKADIYRLFPHCGDYAVTVTTDDGRTYHQHCPGAINNGAVARAFCTCDCHQDVPRCANCRQVDVDLTIDNTCIDVDACIAHQHAVQDANPSMVMINEIRNDLEKVRSIEAAERKIARDQAHAAEVARAKAEGRVAPPSPTRRREPREAKAPQQCHCGCAGMTKGGKFVAGHDAKLKGRLVKAARQTPPDEGRPATKSEAVKAMAELIARDWPRKNVDGKITEQADALVEQHGPDKIIEAAVAGRYSS